MSFIIIIHLKKIQILRITTEAWLLIILRQYIKVFNKSFIYLFIKLIKISIIKIFDDFI